MTLRDLVVEELESSPHADIGTISEHVVKRVEDSDLRWALFEALPDFVRSIVSSRRTQAMRVTSPRPGQMPRIQVAINQFQRALKERVSVGDHWKFLGDCTRGDLLAVARRRQEQATAVLAQKAKFEALAEKMRCHRAETVADLDETLFWEAMHD